MIKEIHFDQSGNNNGMTLAEEAAKIIARTVFECLEKKGDDSVVILAIPGGRSVPPIFASLLSEELPWERVHIFMVDERLVPLTDKECNYKLAMDTFLGELITENILPKENTHPFIQDSRKKDKGVSKYVKNLELVGGKIDIVLVSSGEDGHIAGLYPNHHSVMDEESIFLTMNDSPKPPKDRLSAGVKLLRQADTTILIFMGDAKKDAYKKFKDKSLDYKSCPAKLALDAKKTFVLTQGIVDSK